MMYFITRNLHLCCISIHSSHMYVKYSKVVRDWQFSFRECLGEKLHGVLIRSQLLVTHLASGLSGARDSAVVIAPCEQYRVYHLGCLRGV